MQLSLDLALTALVEEVHKQRPRKYVSVADVLACIEHESHGVSTFNSHDQQFRDNLAAARKITGLSDAQIVAAVTINQGPLIGKLSKFRCEPGYYTWAKGFGAKFTPEEKLLLSCSFGLGQKMARWLLTGLQQKEYMPTIRQFMSSQKTQIMYCIGDLDQLMVGTKGDKTLAFARYNAGPGAQVGGATYKGYGTQVAAGAKKFEELLKGRGT